MLEDILVPNLLIVVHLVLQQPVALLILDLLGDQVFVLKVDVLFPVLAVPFLVDEVVHVLVDVVL